MVQYQAYITLLHSIFVFQIPLVTAASVFFNLENLLHTGLLSARLSQWSVASALMWLDGFQLYFLRGLFGFNSAPTPLLQCMELLGYPQPDLPSNLSAVTHPELLDWYSIRLAMTLATLIPMVFVCGFLSWTLAELTKDRNSVNSLKENR